MNFNPIMNIEINNSNFSQILQSLKEFQLNELNLEFTKDGLSIVSMDPSHISLIELFLCKSYFHTYTCKEKCVLGLNIIILCKLLKGCNEGKITFNYIDGNHYLEIHYSDGSITQEFSIPLMEFQQEHFNIREEYSNSFLINQDDFRKAINRISLIEPNECKISILDDKIYYNGSGETGKIKLNHSILKPGNGDNLDNIHYGFNNLKCFSKAIMSLGENFTLSIEKEFPMRLEMKLDEGNSYLKYFIAPKME